MHLVALALQQFRKEHDLTQRAVAQAIGVTGPSIQALETGQVYPSIPTLKALALLFQWTPQEIGEFVLSVEAKHRIHAKNRAILSAPPEEKP